jgi:hypothetical protein
MSAAFWTVALDVYLLVIGPAMLLLAWLHPNPAQYLGTGVVIGILAQLFSGFAARRLKVMTPAMRRLSLLAFPVFLLCVVGSVIIVQFHK